MNNKWREQMMIKKQRERDLLKQARQKKRESEYNVHHHKLYSKTKTKNIQFQL